MKISDKILQFIDFDESEFICLSHRTYSQEVANKILDEGFEFAESIQTTTDYITNDIVVLKYQQNIRKNYGNINIIICIALKLYNYYLEELKKIPDSKRYMVEELISEVAPRYDEERDQTIYILPKQFIKGYYNEITAEITKNPNFDPFYNPKKFSENLNKLRQSKK